MNGWTYGWGLSGMLAFYQISQYNDGLAMIFALISFICLVVSLTKDSDKK